MMQLTEVADPSASLSPKRRSCPRIPRPRRAIENRAARHRVQANQVASAIPAARIDALVASWLDEEDGVYAHHLIDEEWDDVPGHGMRTDWEFEAAMSRHHYARDLPDSEGFA